MLTALGADLRRAQVLGASARARVATQVPDALRSLHAGHWRCVRDGRPIRRLRFPLMRACMRAGAPSLGYVTGSVEGRVAVDFFEQGVTASLLVFGPAACSRDAFAFSRTPHDPAFSFVQNTNTDPDTDTNTDPNTDQH